MKNKTITKSILLLLIFLSISSFGQEKFVSVEIESNFPKDVNPLFKTKMDSVLTSMEYDFNKESKSMKFASGEEKVTYTLQLNFTKVKLVSKRRKKSAYWINGIGLTAIPLASMAMGVGAPIMITCFPQNSVKSTLNLPYSLNNGKEIKIKICTGSLFIKDEKMINKLAEKYALRVHKELKKLDKRL